MTLQQDQKLKPTVIFVYDGKIRSIDEVKKYLDEKECSITLISSQQDVSSSLHQNKKKRSVLFVIDVSCYDIQPQIKNLEILRGAVLRSGDSPLIAIVNSSETFQSTKQAMVTLKKSLGDDASVFDFTECGSQERLTSLGRSLISAVKDFENYNITLEKTKNILNKLKAITEKYKQHLKKTSRASTNNEEIKKIEKEKESFIETLCDTLNESSILEETTENEIKKLELALRFIKDNIPMLQKRRDVASEKFLIGVAAVVGILIPILGLFAAMGISGLVTRGDKFRFWKTDGALMAKEAIELIEKAEISFPKPKNEK